MGFFSSISKAFSQVANVVTAPARAIIYDPSDPGGSVLQKFYSEGERFLNSPEGRIVGTASALALAPATGGASLAAYGGLSTYENIRLQSKAQRDYEDSMAEAGYQQQQAVFYAGGLTPSSSGGNITISNPGRAGPDPALLIVGALGIGALLLLKGRR